MRMFPTAIFTAAALCLCVVPGTMLSSAPAVAQVSLQDSGSDRALTRRSDEEKKRNAEIDRQYRATVRRSAADAPPPVNDPWASVRSTPAPSQGKR